MSCGKCNVISLFFCIDQSICLSCMLHVACLTAFENCLLKQFAICLVMVVVECYGVGECGWRCTAGYRMYGLPKSMRSSMGFVCGRVRAYSCYAFYLLVYCVCLLSEKCKLCSQCV